jgi:serine/threonine protein kinase
MKPENILMEAAGIIKIADFGLGNFFSGNQKLKTACGSPCYAPPEMLNQ